MYSDENSSQSQKAFGYIFCSNMFWPSLSPMLFCLSFDSFELTVSFIFSYAFCDNTTGLLSKELQVEANAIDEVCSAASSLGNDIIDYNKLPEVDETVQMQIQSARAPLVAISNQLNEREQKLKDQLQRTGEFQDQFEDFERRLKNFDAKISEMKELPISAKSSKISLMLGNLEVS